MCNIKSKGMIADAISKRMTRFFREKMGIGPKETKAYIVDDMIIVRFQGSLMPAEETVLKHSGVAPVKEYRRIAYEAHNEEVAKIIEEITGCKVISIHTDFSTVTGERIDIYVLNSDLDQLLHNVHYQQQEEEEDMEDLS